MSDKKAIILFNDSDLVFIRVVKLKFEKEGGWEVKIASSFDEALKIFDEARPDLFMTEILLSDPLGRTGFDLIKVVKQKGVKTTIVLSNLGQESDKMTAKQVGVDHYFVKSEISLLQLLEQLKNIIN